MSVKEFMDAKERALRKLGVALAEQKVDDNIRSILTIINDMEGYYTSSSCAGRTVLLQIPRLGDKQGAVFLGIWHRSITEEEISTAATKASKGMIWLLAQAPILHIGAQTLPLANAMVKRAVLSGFKNSALKSTGKKIIIELSSTERLDVPLGRNGRLFCDSEYLRLLTEIVNEVINRSQQKLIRFEENLRKKAGV